mgnify:CR=1 FL=1
MASSTGILDKFKETQEEVKEVKSDRKLKVAIIGCGWIAEAHVKSYIKCPDVEIVAAADLIPGKAEAFFDGLGFDTDKLRFYTSYKELLDTEELD